MTYDIHPEALVELEEHAAWYEERRESLGFELMAEVRGTLERIAQQPGLGAPWPRVADARRIALASFPLLVVYVVDGSMLFVVAVAHEKRRPAYWLNRLPPR